MPEFSYKAVRRDGSVATGSLTAASEQTALRQLRGQGLMPVQVSAGAAGNKAAPATGKSQPRSSLGSKLRDKSGEPVKRDDVLSMTSELAVLLRAGLPIDRALKVQIDMSSKPQYTELLNHMLSSVKGGKSLSHALADYPHLFGTFYVNMVRSGEASGRMADVLARLSDYLESARQVRSAVVSALIYPAILATVAILSVMLMLGFVVPQFESLFADMGDALPGMTRAVIAIGDFVKAWGWLLVLLGIPIGYGIRRWLQTPEGTHWKDTRMLRLPMLGDVLFKYEIARFARTMGTLQGNGVSLLQSIGIAIDTVGNTVVRESLQVLTPAVKGGKRMSEALLETRAFTPMVIQMVRVGEESGRLDDMMLELARVYDSDVQAGIKRALTLLEPVLILAMGGMIALIIIAILMGILSVNDLAM